MGFVEAVQHALSNYAVCKGRACRSEYWFFYLFSFLMGFLGPILDGVVIAIAASAGIFLPPLFTVVIMLGLIIPGFCVSIRRLHDIGRPGAHILFSLLPFVGWILILVWMCTDSDPGDNRYGPNPLGEDPSIGGGETPPKVPVTYLPASNYQVTCLAGPLQGQTFSVTQAGLLMGRDSSCNVVFPPMAPGVSSRHCQVFMDGGQLVLVDLSSTYGTYLSDGRRLTPNYPMPINSGTRFWLGSQENCFEVLG